MNVQIKKMLIMVVFILGMIVLFSACKAPRAGCPAYGGEAKRFQVEKIGYH